MTIDNSPNPEIYVADLAAYNAGKLRGEWIDANQDVDNIRAEIEKMLSSSPELFAEEYAIHDYEQFYVQILLLATSITKRWASDMELGGDLFTLTTYDGKVHVFWNH